MGYQGVGRAASPSWQSQVRNAPIKMGTAMKSVGRTWVTCAILFCAFFPSTLANAQRRVPLTDNGAIMYYNTPAAVFDRKSIFAGWVSGTGEIVIAKVINRRLVKKSTLYAYESPDDHAAPALALDGSRLLVATAKHSSDLRVFSVEKSSLDSNEICHVPGSYSYPRFVSVRGQTYLFLRSDPDGSGNFVVIRVTKAGCSQPETLLSADKPDWLYVTAPHLAKDGSIWFAWSIYNQATQRHEGVFAARFDHNFKKTEYTVEKRSSNGPQQLAWSIDKNAVRYVHFDGSMECCGVGNQKLITASINGSVSSSTVDRRMPMYPSWSNVPTECGNGGMPYMSQTIEHGKGTIGSEILSSKHSSTRFDSSVFLCAY